MYTYINIIIHFENCAREEKRRHPRSKKMTEGRRGRKRERKGTERGKGTETKKERRWGEKESIGRGKREERGLEEEEEEERRKRYRRRRSSKGLRVADRWGKRKET